MSSPNTTQSWLACCMEYMHIFLRDGQHRTFTYGLLLTTKCIVLTQFNNGCLKQVELVIHKWETTGKLLIVLIIILKLALVTKVEETLDDILLRRIPYIRLLGHLPISLCEDVRILTSDFQVNLCHSTRLIHEQCTGSKCEIIIISIIITLSIDNLSHLKFTYINYANIIILNDWYSSIVKIIFRNVKKFLDTVWLTLLNGFSPFLSQQKTSFQLRFRFRM